MPKGQKRGEIKPNTTLDKKEILLEDVILEYISTKTDNYGNDNCFFKVTDLNKVEHVMSIESRLPIWKTQDNDVLLKVKPQNIDYSFIDLGEDMMYLNTGQHYEAIINLVRYSFTPKDKQELIEGYSANIIRIKPYQH